MIQPVYCITLMAILSGKKKYSHLKKAILIAFNRRTVFIFRNIFLHVLWIFVVAVVPIEINPPKAEIRLLAMCVVKAKRLDHLKWSNIKHLIFFIGIVSATTNYAPDSLDDHKFYVSQHSLMIIKCLTLRVSCSLQIYHD